MTPSQNMKSKLFPLQIFQFKKDTCQLHFIFWNFCQKKQVYPFFAIDPSIWYIHFCSCTVLPFYLSLHYNPLFHVMHLSFSFSSYYPPNDVCMDKRLFTSILAPDERAKHAYYCQRHQDEVCLGFFLLIILNN